MKVLIVDDSPSLRMVTKNFVLKVLPDAQILEADDGIKAEVLLQESFLIEEPIDIVFLDWVMPRLSGKEFLTNIRGIEQFKVRPAVIMLTAETYPEQISLISKFSVSAYITKPFTEGDVAKALQKIIESRKTQKAG